MDKMFLKCRELLLGNTKSKLSDEAIDLLSISILALYLNDGEIILERMPEIIKNLDIIKVDYKTVFEMIREINRNAVYDEYKDTAGANVTLFNNNGIIETLIISLSQRNSKLEIIDTMVHELTHLLRKGEILGGDGCLSFYEGISVRHRDMLYNNVIRVHVGLEDAIVEHHAKETITTLVEFLKGEKEDSICKSLLDGEQLEYSDVEPCAYNFFNRTLDILCEDDIFKEELEKTFRTPDHLGKGMMRRFNAVLGSDDAFADYSCLFDQMIEALINHDNRRSDVLCGIIAEMTKSFFFESGANEKRGIKRPLEKA